ALKTIQCLLLGVIFFGFFGDSVFAFDLVDFIAQPTFESHTLSTGEFIHFTDEGGGSPLGQPVRQYKNGNWEQFYIGSWIYRREDTSWQVGGVDPLCTNGNRAIYTLDSEVGSCSYPNGASPNSDGAGWAPGYGSSEGDTWTQQTHNIVPIDSGVAAGVY